MTCESEERIKIINGIEYEKKTGKKVYRNSKDRPYILQDCEHNPIEHYDQGLIYLAFLRRTVQDASGPDFFDNSLTEEIQNEAREYLLNGLLERYGQYVFEGVGVKTQRRVYESRFMKYRETDELHESTITIKEICDYSEIEYDMFIIKIKSWSSSSWVRDHVFYTNVIEATKGIE